MNNKLIHEVWLDPQLDGQMLPGLCLAGPMGDDFRSLLDAGAVKVTELRGHSHFDVTAKYWRFQGWGEYQTDHPRDHQPYPDEWAVIQHAYFSSR